MSSPPSADADEPPPTPLPAQNVPPCPTQNENQLPSAKVSPVSSATPTTTATTTTKATKTAATTTATTTGTTSRCSSSSSSASTMPFCPTPELCAPRPPKRPRPTDQPHAQHTDAVPLPKRFAPASLSASTSTSVPAPAPAATTSAAASKQQPARPPMAVPVPMAVPLPLPLPPRQPGPKRPPPVGSQRFTAAGKPMPLIDTSAPHSTLFVPPDTSGLTKREARLVKNRAAAFLSRQRRREQFDLLDGRCRALGRLVWVLLTVLSTLGGERPGSGVLAALACEDADVLAALQQVVDNQGVLTSSEDEPHPAHAGSPASGSASANGGGSGSSSDTSSTSHSVAAPTVRTKSAHEILSSFFGHPPAPPADEVGKSLRAEIKRLKSLLAQQEQPGSPSTVVLPPNLPPPVPSTMGLPWGVPFFPLGTPFAPSPLYPLCPETDPAPFKTLGKGLNLTLAPEAEVEEERGKGKAALRPHNRDLDRDRDSNITHTAQAREREGEDEPDFTTLGMEWEDPLLSVVLGETGILPISALDGPSSRPTSPPPLTLPQLLEKEEDHPTPSSLDSQGRSTAATSTSNPPPAGARNPADQAKECICPASVRAERSVRRAKAHVATLVVALAFAYVASRLPHPRAYEPQRAEDRTAS